MRTIRIHRSRVLQIAAALLPFIAFVASARADIFQWEYISPADPSQGKQLSTDARAPGGAGVDAVPGAGLAFHNFTMAYLIGADLTGADMASVNLTNADLSHARLTNAYLGEATLTDANFTDAKISGANFDIHYYNIAPGIFEFSAGTGITLAQLYSTASFKAHDLTGIKLELHNLAGANFADQNFANANFATAALAGASFRGANLANAEFAVASQCHPVGCGIDRYAGLVNADLSAADARGADLSTVGAITTNLILPDGHIHGLDLNAGSLLVVRDYDGDPTRTNPFIEGAPAPVPPIPITIDQHLTLGSGGTLQMVFEANAWDSTISFAPGISVTLGGTLELAFADDMNLASQVGRTFRLFDWTGVNPTGTFLVSSAFKWDISKLYTTGDVKLTGIPEPGTLVLSAIASAVLAIRRRKLRCRRSSVLQIVAMFLSVAIVGAARADIIQWEYINPADPSQGKRQSTLLCPGGAGTNAVPGAYLANRDLTMAYLIGADLTSANGRQTNLTGADLSQANLAKSNFSSSKLNNADLIQANLTKADFNSSNLTNANLYQANLTNALFYSTNLTNANLSQTNLTNGNFSDAVLTDAVFTDAQVQGASFFGITSEQLYSTASYQAHDLTGIALSGLLSGWNFAGQNLTNANFYGTLNGTDFTGAEVRGAKLLDYSTTGFTPSQLYSTASYQAHDMSGISLEFNEMSGWNFAGQKLSNASFRGATITGANLREANLVNSSFSAAILTNADFTGADVRGANFDKEYGSFGYSLNGTGITLAQLYSTGSYQTHDLTGISLGVNDLSGWNFTGQNLTNASFVGTNLTNANLRGANLTNAHFGGALFCYDFSCTRGYANLTNADFTDAEVTGADLGGTGITPSQLYSTASYQAHDLRGIKFGSDDRSGWNFTGQNLTNSRFGTSRPGPNSYQVYAIVAGADFTGADARGAYLNTAEAITTNLILPDGHIDGLELDGGVSLVVRDYDVNPAPGIGPIPITVDQHLVMGPGGTLRMAFEADAWDSTISFTPGIPVTLGGTLELTFADDINLASQVGRTFDLFDWTGVNPTGAFAISSPYAWNLSNLYTTGEVTLTAVPEPSTLVLMMVAAAGWCVCRRR